MGIVSKIKKMFRAISVEPNEEDFQEIIDSFRKEAIENERRDAAQKKEILVSAAKSVNNKQTREGLLRLASSAEQNRIENEARLKSLQTILEVKTRK